MKFVLFIALIWAGWLVFKRAANPMPRDEAARLLGIAADADGPTVIDAHRRLIARVHPDVGGNDELAARINRARDVLLKN
ncbi:Molecular chaperone DnaJ [Sphingomonas antarctica]|uniref:J domain-containing protein n=1 Tax=Sphingomonas antarctica TaxID=2040274 RepID=UPI0039EB339E